MIRLSVVDPASIIQGSEAATALKHAQRRAALDQISRRGSSIIDTSDGS